MVSHTRDNHVRVNSPVLAAYWGEAQTPLLVRIIQGVPVVTGFTNDSVARAAGVRIGDVIERVDGEAVATRLARRERYLTASTPQWLHWAAVRSLLAGPEGSTAVLRLRGATGGAEKGPSHEVRLPRRKAYEPSCYGCRTGPILRMLPGNVGYADLDRLPVSRVDSMFELFRGTRAIIFDMRGYPQGTAWPIDLCWRGVARTSGAGRRAALQSRFCAPNNAADWRSRRRKHEVRSAQPGHGRGGLLRGLREIHLESWQDLLYDYWCDWTDDHTDRRRVEGVGRLATHDKDLRDFRWVIASATRRRRGHAGMPRGSPAARQNSGKEIGERLGLPLCVRPERSHHAVSANPSPTPLRHRAASRSARPPRSTSNPPLPPLCKDPNRPINNGVDIVDIHVIAPVTAESGSSETDGPQEHLFRNSYGDASTTR